MISLTRINGDTVAINCDLIERAEETPDTVITLTSGARYVVKESIAELSLKIQHFRAASMAMAQQMLNDPDFETRTHLRLVPNDSSDGPGGSDEIDDLVAGKAPDTDHSLAAPTGEGHEPDWDSR